MALILGCNATHSLDATDVMPFQFIDSSLPGWQSGRVSSAAPSPLDRIAALTQCFEPERSAHPADGVSSILGKFTL